MIDDDDVVEGIVLLRKGADTATTLEASTPRSSVSTTIFCPRE